MSGGTKDCGRPFPGNRIRKDRTFTNTRTVSNLVLPFINSNSFPPAPLAGVGGGIAWDIVTQRPYHSDGFEWLPIGGGVPGTVESYTHVKDGDMIITPFTPTILTSWEIGSSVTYHTIPEWNLTTGVYSSGVDEIVTIGANISWKGGISNLGSRILRIKHFDFSTATLTTVKEFETQADPDCRVDTTQEIQIHLKNTASDRVFLEVEHNAIVPLTIEGGDHTSITGFRVNLT